MKSRHTKKREGDIVMYRGVCLNWAEIEAGGGAEAAARLDNEAGSEVDLESALCLGLAADGSLGEAAGLAAEEADAPAVEVTPAQVVDEGIVEAGVQMKEVGAPFAPDAAESAEAVTAPDMNCGPATADGEAFEERSNPLGRGEVGCADIVQTYPDKHFGSFDEPSEDSRSAIAPELTWIAMGAAAKKYKKAQWERQRAMRARLAQAIAVLRQEKWLERVAEVPVPMMGNQSVTGGVSEYGDGILTFADCDRWVEHLRKKRRAQARLDKKLHKKAKRAQRKAAPRKGADDQNFEDVSYEDAFDFCPALELRES